MDLRPRQLQRRFLDPGNNHSSCLTLGAPISTDEVTGTVIHPSGLKGTFVVEPVKHGRSYVPLECLGTDHDDQETQGSYALWPKAWYGFSITERSLSGAGIPGGRVWRYSYSEPNDSWSNCGIGCPDWVATYVENPDQSTLEYMFSNKFDYSEGQLRRVTHHVGSAGSIATRIESNEYLSPKTGLLPVAVGGVMRYNVNADQMMRYSPLNQRKIVQEGDTYTWQAEAFNSYAQVTRVKRFNSINSQWLVEEQTDYLNDTDHWVLGLPKRVTNLSTGKVVNEYHYETTHFTLTSRSRFGQAVMSYQYNTQGQLISFTDGKTHKTTLGSYVDSNGVVVSRGYKRGIPLAIGYPDGKHQTLEVDDFGQIESVTDQANATTRYYYDPVGRLREIRYPSGDEQSWNTKTIDYEPVDSGRGLVGKHWVRTVGRGNQRQVTYFNALLQPVLADTYIDVGGRTRSHSNVYKAYDYKGQATFTSYPVAGTPKVTDGFKGVRNEYDALGRLRKTFQDAEPDVPGANANNQLVTITDYLQGASRRVTDPKHNTTTTSYQVFDQPSYEAPVKVVAPAGVTQNITRNLYGNPIIIHQYGSYDGLTGDVIKKLVYDNHQRLCRTIEPETDSEVREYDDAGNLLWSASGLDLPVPDVPDEGDCERDQVVPAARVIRGYDPMNRMTIIDYPDNTVDSVFTYDSLGRVATAQSGIATWTYKYNKLGLLRSETLDMEGYHWPVVYDHDANGAVKQIIYPDGKQVAYRPDALGRPAQAGVYASSVLYEPDGSLKYFLGGNGVDYFAQKNGRNILSDFTYAAGDTMLVSQAFLYDANGNRTSVTDLAGPAGKRNKSYQYDPLNRLTHATADGLWGEEIYRYDPINNLHSMYTDNQTRVYGYDGDNRLTDIKVDGTTLHSFGYDPQGNVNRKDSTNLVFDEANRLNQVTGVASYDYDASGRRVRRTTAGGVETYYVYGSAGKLLFQLDAAAGVFTDYVYLGNKLLAKVRRGVNDLVLNPPSNIYFDTDPNDGNYTVMWFKVPTARYELQESSDGGVNWREAYKGTDNSKSFSGRAAGSYLYRVRACLEECSDWRDSDTVGVWPELATVTVPSGVQSTGFTVSWTRPSTATRFDVDQQKDDGTWVRIATDMPDTSITRPLLTVGSYVYRVAAKNSHGSRGWVVSNPVTVLYPPRSALTLSVPSISSKSSYTVSWSADVNADRYQLEERKDSGAWEPEYEGANPSTVVSGVTNGAHYSYRVTACNSAGCGPYSTVETVKIAIPPPLPTGVYANDLRVNPKLETLTIVWNASAGATYYEVKDIDADGVVGSTAGTSKTVESAYNEPLSMHSYAVRACNPYACSGWVNAVHRNVYNPPGGAPTLSAPDTSGTGSYTVSWGSVYQASSYTLQESVNGGAWSTVYSGSGKSKAVSGKKVASYRYRVRASNSGGIGPWSATKTVTVAIITKVTGLTAQVRWVSTGLGVVAAPSPLEAASSDATDVSPTMMPPPPQPTYAWFLTASWNGATGATRYEVKATDTVTGAVKTFSVTTLSIPATEVSHSGQSVTARACGASGCSAWSSAVTAVKQ